jgi:ribosomal protein L7/L12
MSDKDIIKALDKLTLVELYKLVKACEERLGL